ncbi:MAG: galactose mutarotase [Clostridiales bacterium]|nr:galactose mutarotase [Clostridiales bacterium]
MSVTEREFGRLSTGEPVKLYHIENTSGAYVEVISFGAILVRVCVPDRDGDLKDVVLGYDQLAPYEERSSFFGATVGRNGNRIAGASFEIQGKRIDLAKNENGVNNLHSGPNGFEKKLWSASAGENCVKFSRISPDGENGFPGNFDVSVTYEFTESNALRILYEGVSDAPTVANMTNHSFFNLAGEGSGAILDQYLAIYAKTYTPVIDPASIPTGEYAPVKGTPMDFTEYKRIGQEIDADFPQLVYTGGYDHNYVTDQYEKGVVRRIADAYCEETGIAMAVSSDCPCVQFYAGNFIEEEKGKKGHLYTRRDGFCLETQTEPNAVNEKAFHSPVLAAGERYSSVTEYSFSLMQS